MTSTAKKITTDSGPLHVDTLSFKTIAGWAWNRFSDFEKIIILRSCKPVIPDPTARCTWRMLLPTQQARIRIVMRGVIEDCHRLTGADQQ